MSSDLRKYILESNIFNANSVGEIVAFLDLIKDKLDEYWSSDDRKDPTGDYNTGVFENYDNSLSYVDNLVDKVKISDFQDKIGIIDSLTKFISFFKSVRDMSEDDYKKNLPILWLELNLDFYHTGASEYIQKLKVYLQNS